MSNLSKTITYFIGIITYILICLFGVLAQVSWSVILTRAITATLIVSSLTYLTCYLIYNLVLKEIILEPNPDTNFEFIADEELPISDLNNNETMNNSQTETETHDSLTQTQIETNIENLINQDPQKAADILRKMGLD